MPIRLIVDVLARLTLSNVRAQVTERKYNDYTSNPPVQADLSTDKPNPTDLTRDRSHALAGLGLCRRQGRGQGFRGAQKLPVSLRPDRRPAIYSIGCSRCN